MSDTPRTDAEQPKLYRGEWVRSDFARELERELAEAKAENATLLAQIKLDEKAKEMMLREWHKVNDENARLRKALTNMANMPEYDQDDSHRLRHQAKLALVPSA